MIGEMKELVGNLRNRDPAVSRAAAEKITMAGDRRVLPILYKIREEILKETDIYEGLFDPYDWREVSFIENVIISLLTVDECRNALESEALLDEWWLNRRIHHADSSDYWGIKGDDR